MADFESCYFCGEGPGETVGEYGIIPAAFEPSDDQQRSVVLCQECREKLTAMMRAVVDASDAEPAAPDADERAAVEVDVGGDDIIDATPDEEPSDDESAAAEASGGLGSAGTGLAPDDTETGGDDAGSGEAGSDGGDAEESAAAEPPADEEEAPEDMRRTQGTGVSFETAAAGDENPEGGEGDDESPPQRERGAASVDQGASDAAADAAVYRKVIRLLQNREFPVRRDEIAQVAASAYELRPEETQAAIDAAVRKGLLVEDGGVLRKE